MIPDPTSLFLNRRHGQSLLTKANKRRILVICCSAILPRRAWSGSRELAAQSEVLEAKRVVQYFEMESRSLLNRTRPGMPFEWSLNPYRGCEFGCRYCYARYTHEFMELRESDDFEDKIYAKSGIGPILRRELKRIDGSKGIAIGTATDPYQPAERRFRRTRAALEVFAQQSGLALSITTKSDLVTRDIPLLQEIAQTEFRQREHDDHDARYRLGPFTRTARAAAGTAAQSRRRRSRRRALPVGVFPNPIMPLITDQQERLDRLAKAARDSGASYFGGGVLFLMPCSRKVFFPFVEKHFPHLLRRYQEKYERDAYLKGPYREVIRERIAAIRDKYGLNSGPPRREVAAWENPQGLLF